MKKTTKMVAVLAAMSVMVLGAATMVSAAEKSGWVKEGSDWYYYVKDDAVKNQWALSGNVWYFLGEDGKMVTEEFIDNTIPEVVDEEDLEVVGADFDDYYYVDENGAMVTGWKKIEVKSEIGPTEGDGKSWYYFGANGIMYGDTWVKSGENWFYVKSNGRMATRSIVPWDSENYYVDADGVMITGWYKTKDNNTEKNLFGAKDKWLYADKDGVLADNGWKKVGGAWYYFGLVNQGATPDAIGAPSGLTYVMQGEAFIQVTQTRPPHAVQKFYLTKSGAMETGLFKITDAATRNSSYFVADKDGKILSGIQTVSGKYYLFDTATYVRYGDAAGQTEKYAFAVTSGAIAVPTDYANDAAAKAAATNGAVVYKLGTATKWN